MRWEPSSPLYHAVVVLRRVGVGNIGNRERGNLKEVASSAYWVSGGANNPQSSSITIHSYEA